jgi:hypothetical protein
MPSLRSPGVSFENPPLLKTFIVAKVARHPETAASAEAKNDQLPAILVSLGVGALIRNGTLVRGGFLCRASARYIHNTAIAVDGGATPGF